MINEIELRKHGKDISKLVPAIVKDPAKIPKKILSQDKEFDSINEVKQKIADEFDAEINIIKAEETDEQKRNTAMPGKPAILIK